MCSACDKNDDRQERRFYGCNFTVEHTTRYGGDALLNIPPTIDERRVRFEGPANDDLYSALTDAVWYIVKSKNDTL